MPGLKVTARMQFNADPNLYTRTLVARLNTVFNGGIRAFVEAIAVDGLIRVDTGMSKASLLPLARAVRHAASVIISPERPYRKGLTEMDGTYISHAYRYKQAGILRGQDAYEITQGSADDLKWLFTFDVMIYQWSLYESSKHQGHGPWNSLPVGKAAMRGYLKERLPGVYPRYSEWIKTSAR